MAEKKSPLKRVGGALGDFFIGPERADDKPAPVERNASPPPPDVTTFFRPRTSAEQVASEPSPVEIPSAASVFPAVGIPQKADEETKAKIRRSAFPGGDEGINSFIETFTTLMEEFKDPARCLAQAIKLTKLSPAPAALKAAIRIRRSSIASLQSQFDEMMAGEEKKDATESAGRISELSSSLAGIQETADAEVARLTAQIEQVKTRCRDQLRSRQSSLAAEKATAERTSRDNEENKVKFSLAAAELDRELQILEQNL